MEEKCMYVKKQKIVQSRFSQVSSLLLSQFHYLTLSQRGPAPVAVIIIQNHDGSLNMIQLTLISAASFDVRTADTTHIRLSMKTKIEHRLIRIIQGLSNYLFIQDQELNMLNIATNEKGFLVLKYHKSQISFKRNIKPSCLSFHSFFFFLSLLESYFQIAVMSNMQ
jgi:hypothetical protein